MADLNKFNKEISGFRNGTLEYEYSFNSVGNLFFKRSSEVFNQSFLKIPVENFEYDVRKIGELYSLKFEEFSESPPETDRNSVVSELERTVEELRLKLKVESDDSVQDRLTSEVLASKDLIIQMRISAGEGRFPEEFSDEFPYFSKKDSSN